MPDQSITDPVASGKRRLRSPRFPRTCEQCGVLFFVTPSRVAHTATRFCSWPCKFVGMRINPSGRFWNRVNKSNDCWLWTGPPNRSGYGCIRIRNQDMGAHRFSWELHFGPIPERLCVLHRCDVRICVRPDHLFLGTRTDNNLDMVTKGRNRTSRARRKLTETQVQEIRALYATGKYKQSEIAQMFSIIQGHVSRLVREDQGRNV